MADGAGAENPSVWVGVAGRKERSQMVRQTRCLYVLFIGFVALGWSPAPPQHEVGGEGGGGVLLPNLCPEVLRTQHPPAIVEVCNAAFLSSGSVRSAPWQIPHSAATFCVSLGCRQECPLLNVRVGAWRAH